MTMTTILHHFGKVPILQQKVNFILDRLQLVLVSLSPRTWWGILDYEKKKGGSIFSSTTTTSFDKSTMNKSFLGLVLPIVVLWIIDYVLLQHRYYRSFSATITTTTTMKTYQIMKKTMISSQQRLLIASLLSPWSLGCLRQLVLHLSLILHSIRIIRKNRFITLSRATTMLQERINSNRAYRRGSYDIYLPPQLSPSPPPSSFFSADTNTAATKKEEEEAMLKRCIPAILLIPGAFVPHESYSEVASRLSDMGYAVAVLSLEPLRLAYHRIPGADTTSIQRIMDRITNELQQQQQALLQLSLTSSSLSSSSQRKDGDNISTKVTVTWTLMGHSMGAMAAMKLFSEFITDYSNNNNNNNNNNSNNNNTALEQTSVLISSSTTRTTVANAVVTNKLILWGVAAFIPFLTNLSNYNDVNILIVQGTNDDIVDMMKDRQEEFAHYFPSTTILNNNGNNVGSYGGNTRTKYIIGGTHDGFGSYRSSTSSDLAQKSDEEEQNYYNNDDNNNHDSGSAITMTTMTLSEQHKQACDATVRFLRTCT